MRYIKLLSVVMLIFFTGCGGASKETIEAGVLLYAKCSECHGIDGTTKALGKSKVLNGQSQVDIESELKAYKAGTRNEAGMGAWKQGMMAPYSDADINALAAYISTL